MSDLTSIFKGGFVAQAFTPSNFDLADPTSAFIEEARENGIEIGSDFVGDGSIHRYSERDSKRGEKDGWAVLHLDGPIPVGVYGSFKGGGWEKKWTANIGRQMTMIEKLQVDQWLSENKKRREEAKKMAQEEAAKRAEDEVGSLADAADDHPYLIKKHIKAYGIKIDRSGRLVIPMISADGEIQSYQRIDQEGNKRFLMGGKVDGGFFEIRGNRNVVYICEGYATGASIHEATGASVFVAFYADNLIKVSKAVRGLFPAAKMFIGADNDQFTDGNPGITKARLAARESNAEVVYPEFNESDLAHKPNDFNDLMAICGIDEVKRQLNIVVSHKASFKFQKACDLELRPIQWAIEDFIENDSLAQIFGDPGCGKTFVSIDMALCMATGTPWHGHEVEQGAVFYIAGEGHNGISRRIHAWALGNGVDISNAHFYKSERQAMLYDATESALVAESVREIVTSTGVLPKMIVIDTLARNMGGDENSTEDMNSFISHLDIYLRQPYKCCVLVVHHSGAMDKDRSRGSTALRGALDAEYKVELDQNTKSLTFTPKKMKDAEMPAPKSFSLNQVDLPINDKHGIPIKGAYLQTIDISGLVKKAKSVFDQLGKNQRKALVVLEGMVYAREKEGVMATITMDDWKDACKDSGVSDRRRFDEIKNALISKKLINVTGLGVVTLCYDLSETSETSDSDTDRTV